MINQNLLEPRKILEDEEIDFMRKVNDLYRIMMRDKNLVSQKQNYSFRNIVVAKPKKKYTNIDMGVYFPGVEDEKKEATGGTLMIENDTGDIYGIKAYGVINRLHKYGNLDTIEDYFWGHYYPQKI